MALPQGPVWRSVHRSGSRWAARATTDAACRTPSPASEATRRGEGRYAIARKAIAAESARGLWKADAVTSATPATTSGMVCVLPPVRPARLRFVWAARVASAGRPSCASEATWSLRVMRRARAASAPTTPYAKFVASSLVSTLACACSAKASVSCTGAPALTAVLATHKKWPLAPGLMHVCNILGSTAQSRNLCL